MIFEHFRKACFSPLALTAAIFTTAAISGSDALAGPPVATFHNGVWSPRVSYDSATLRVSGPDGYVHQATVSAGELISISGATLADGQYSYDLKLFSHANVLVGPDDSKVSPEETDSNGRARNMKDRTGNVTVYEQSGGFQVKSGNIIWNPSAIE